MSSSIASGGKIPASKLRITKGTYTPVISAATSTPAVGASGFLTGKYFRYDYMVHAIIELLISGVGASIAGTSWRITLPYAADLSFHAADILNATSDNIGSYQTRSDTAAQAKTGACLLSGPSGSDQAGTAIIFYSSASNTSVGAADFTGTARIKAEVCYVADSSAF